MTPADVTSTVQCFKRGVSPAVTLTIVGNGAAFMSLPLPSNTAPPTCSSLGFTVSFSFLIAPRWVSGNNGWYYKASTEGFTFSLLTTPAMGQGGNQLGYGGLTGLAVDFDTRGDSFDPNDNSRGNHIGIDVGGRLTSVATAPLPFELEGQWSSLIHAVIKYDPTTQLLSVLVFTDTQSAFEPVLARYVDLCSALELQSTSVAPTLYVGFTGGSFEPVNIGKYFIYDWQVSTGEAKHTVSL